MTPGSRPWLLLDLAGVLLRFEPARRLERLAALFGLDDETLRARIAASAIGDRLDDGRAGTQELAAFVADLAGREVGAEEAWDLWLAPFTPDARAFAALPELSAHWRLGLFTNNASAITRLFDARAFERMFFSADLGLRKPDPESFRRVTALLDVEPGEIVFVDDGSANVDAARVAGWRSLLFRAGDDLAALAARS